MFLTIFPVLITHLEPLKPIPQDTYVDEKKSWFPNNRYKRLFFSQSCKPWKNLPSRSSIKAPPPMLIHENLSARPGLMAAAAESPPPMIRFSPGLFTLMASITPIIYQLEVWVFKHTHRSVPYNCFAPVKASSNLA